MLASEYEQAKGFYLGQTDPSLMGKQQPKKYTNNAQAFFGGLDAAKNIQLNRPLEAPKGEQRRLLS